jgi:hypothetical protein
VSTELPRVDHVPGQIEGDWAVALVEKHKVRWDRARTVSIVNDRPQLLAGVIAQEVGELATITCPTCHGEGVAYVTSTSGRKAKCRECWGATTVQVPASEIEP